MAEVDPTLAPKRRHANYRTDPGGQGSRGTLAMSTGVVLLGQLAGRLSALEFACNRCDRHGWPRTARLLAEHGADMPMPACCGSSPLTARGGRRWNRGSSPTRAAFTARGSQGYF
jgi:hypothetical protein